jgi:5-methylcytosine-specific restriction protein A
MAEPFCRECSNHGKKVLATDIDHIISHNGDLKIFWNRLNLQPLCKECHQMKTSKEANNRSK